jgi:hypothetical protein
MLDRSYIEEMNRDSEGFFAPGKDFSIVAGDTGSPYRSREEVMKRTPASKRTQALTKEALSLTQELIEKEESMSESEFSEYKENSKYLASESDKLYYLSLSGSEKEQYINTKKTEYFEDHGKGKDIVKSRSIHASDIYLGMTKDDVIGLWGRPTKVQVAGNPKYQNELWLFNEDGSYKQVYFEEGKVNGWALDL